MRGRDVLHALAHDPAEAPPELRVLLGSIAWALALGLWLWLLGAVVGAR